MHQNRLSRLEQVNDLLLYRLSGVTRAVGSLVIRLCEGRYGITRREWGVLALLAVEDGLSLMVVVERTRQDKARTSRVVASLVKKGLVQRVAKLSNRRQVELWLSPAGRSLYEELMPTVRGLNQELLQALSEEEVALLDVWLDRLQGQANQMLARYTDELPRTQRRKGGAARLLPR
jgi:DNA-binding MarR family transcriptional regulator